MRVIRADVLGMCFGVRDALRAIERVKEPQVVTIHGELVHNEVVLRQLDQRGFSAVDESQRDAIPSTSHVLITAHGISNRERSRLEASRLQIIDTTCPLVRRAHDAALLLCDEGRHIVVIGKPGHVEVKGLVEDLPSYSIVESESDVTTYPHNRLGIISQTTTTDRAVARIHAAIIAQNPFADIHFIDTVCLPTKEHQRSLEHLIDQVDAIVVVGGLNSNNTRALAERARERGRPALHVQHPSDLNPEWFQPDWTIGLTAGTSTLDTTIDAVHEALTTLAERFESAFQSAS